MVSTPSKPSTRKVITSAEPFGFGPVSKLRSVGALLRAEGWEPDFVGAGTALSYARDESEVFGTVTELRSVTELRHLDASEYAAAVSVMDPFLAVWAAHNKLPCLYVDSLFWFWGWPDQEVLRGHWDAVMGPDVSIAEALEALQGLSMPAAEYVGHRSATVSCVQRTPSTPSVSDAVQDIAPVVLTGAIVDLSRRRDVSRDVWMVGLSGLLNPLITVEEATLWADAALRFVDEAFTAAGIPDAKVCLTGNTEVIAGLEHIPPRFGFEARDAEAVLDLFNRAHACLTPPGLTTMLESLAHDCPVIPLPPQHYGHERILGEFSDHDAQAFPQAATAALLGVEATGDAAADTRRLIRAFHASSEAGGEPWPSMVASMAAGLRRALDSRETVLDRQRSIVTGFIGGFSGAQETAAAFETMQGVGGGRLG